ncbi:ABC transporter ATP-binding protein [Acidaminobacter sp. JC074]|uniref:ABC transporter ATP-binding protein n=1 Tax=Acidaminobacter sp. JC074 TaxID=2530199 RepID=UPI001F0E2FED|nr:ABC transporter ATP-binding protein [Acidaminobacter sp. JC074]MCH4891303.1 ABC transporter ATP-binding protein [Acidaminobacter sp. JC074]
MLFRHLKEIMLKYKFRYIFGIIFIIICDGLQLFTPEVLGNLTNDINTGSLTEKAIYNYIFLIMILAIGVAFFRFLWRRFVVAASRKIEYDLRKKFFGHLETLSMSYFHTHTAGSLMAHATNDITAVRNSFGMGVVMIVDSSFLTLFTVYRMITNTDLTLTLLALIPMPFIAISAFVLGGVIQKRFRSVQQAFENITTKVQEAFSGIRVIKAFAREKNENLSFKEVNDDNFKENMKLARMHGILFPLIMFISTSSLIVAITLGGIMVIDNRLPLGSYVEFLLYLGILTWPIIAIGWVVNVLQQGIASLKRINIILDAEAEIKDHEHAEYIEDLKPVIEFKNLNFTYPNTDIPVLENVSFKVEAGKTLAIVGKTGTGKTTIANLMMRLYDSNQEEILLGGVPIKQLQLKQIREMIGYVPQDNFLFSTKIRDNIAFSNPDLSEDKIIAASKIAHVHNEILGFPEGYETLLGEKGINLSGGQKQRISIARAIAEDPKVLILDDSLSAVDTKTEDSILRYLQTEIADKTCIIIAHRISTIKDADEIIVLHENKIAERGTHDELVKLNGLYNETYQKQLLEDKVNRD